MSENLNPYPYNLNDPKEVARLLRETEGYMHTCRRAHHGTDFEGRTYAMDALKQGSPRILACVEAMAGVDDPVGTMIEMQILAQAIVTDMAGLVADPAAPDFEPTTSNNNPADVQILHDVYSNARALLSRMGGGE